MVPEGTLSSRIHVPCDRPKGWNREDCNHDFQFISHVTVKFMTKTKHKYMVMNEHLAPEYITRPSPLEGLRKSMIITSYTKDIVIDHLH